MTGTADPDRAAAPAGPPQGRGAPWGEAADGRFGGNIPPAGPPLGHGAPWGEAAEGRFGGNIPPAGRAQWIGILVLAALVLLLWAEPLWVARIQTMWFDACQVLVPRTVRSTPATVIEIDQKSVVALGQWPWPRTVLAQLVREIARAKPVAIGLDILMPEADRSSPEHWLDNMPMRDADLALSLAALPSHDTELARAIGSAPVVLAMAGTPEPTGMALFATPILIEGAAPNDAAALRSAVVQFAGAVTNLTVLEHAASGHGMVSAETPDGIIRRIPMVSSVGGTLVPALTLEMLRVAVKAPVLRLKAAGTTIVALAAGDFSTATEPDGAVRVHYSHRDPRRFVSAIDVLQGRVEADRLERKLVLVGITALGLVDFQGTPLGERMPGVEIHAQLLENIFDGSLLVRPAWARALEIALFAALGALLIRAAPRWRTPATAGFAVAAMVMPALAALGVLAWRGLLFDAATPALALLVLFATLLVLTLGEASRERRTLQRQMQVERVHSARVSGELEAAQRVQVAMLPHENLFRGDARIDLAATMVPAREVGGDLYEFFRLDGRRVFFLIGDVAGKGLSASIFMAVSKALAKSAAVRHPDDDIGAWMSTANREISRDNIGGLFVTAFAGILDLDSGDLVYCNAGHEEPYCAGSASGLRRLDRGDGPPLCTVDDWDYRSEHTHLDPGELLCLVTDGVTDMRDPAGTLYGRARMESVLEGLRASAASARVAVDTLSGDVRAFAGGAEPSDDLTVLAIRWNGPLKAPGAARG